MGGMWEDESGGAVWRKTSAWGGGGAVGSECACSHQGAASFVFSKEIVMRRVVGGVGPWRLLAGGSRA